MSIRMTRHTADVLDFMGPFRERQLRKGDERASHYAPEHDAFVAEYQRREREAQERQGESE